MHSPPPTSIPTVDLAPLRHARSSSSQKPNLTGTAAPGRLDNGGASAAVTVGQELVAALAGYGFAYVSGHGISEEVIEEAFARVSRGEAERRLGSLFREVMLEACANACLGL